MRAIKKNDLFLGQTIYHVLYQKIRDVGLIIDTYMHEGKKYIVIKWLLVENLLLKILRMVVIDFCEREKINEREI